MKRFNEILNLSKTALINTALVSIAASVALGGVGLTALYLIKYVDTETPEMKALSCALNLSDDCPKQKAKLANLEARLSELNEQTKGAEQKLNNLRRVESSTDKLTAFQNYDDPNSDLSITVGTEYTQLVEPENNPRFFCYISLTSGTHESRNLHYQNTFGSIELSKSVLRKAGVSERTLSYARSVCKPYRIGG